MRCWYAPEDLKIGARTRDVIDQSIHVHEKLLVVLSSASIESDWVRNEVEAAMEKERKTKTDVLFPVRIDNSVNETNRAWAATLRRERNTGDFTNWKDPASYAKAFERVLSDLQPPLADPMAESDVF